MLLASTHAVYATENEAPAPSALRYHGELTVFGVHHGNPQYNEALSANFVETTLRLGLTDTHDPRYTVKLGATLGAVRGDSLDLTFVEDETETVVDVWNLTLNRLFGAPLALTLGRQELGLGDGFVVWDGVFDRAAAYTGAMRSFTGGSLVYTAEPYTLTSFALRTEEHFLLLDGFLQSYEGESRLYGAHLKLGNTAARTLELGAYSRADDSRLDNDTQAVSVRGVYAPPALPGVELAGEVVREWGHTRLAAGLPAATTQERDAWGGHADITYRFQGQGARPHLKLSRIHFSGDDPDTDAYEAYDPLFFGFTDWGRWYLGSITSWELFNTNERVWLAEVGLPLSATVLARAQFYDFDLDREWVPGAGRNWSREVNLIVDWFPSARYSVGLAVNYARPDAAARAFAGPASRVEVVTYAVLHF